jgi:hypothetical protein
MPRPLLFVACEKVIVAQDQTISIVSILEKMISNVPASAALPEHASVPMRWSVVMVWLYEDSDKGKRFETISRLIAQDGSIAMHTEPSEIIATSEKPRFRHVGVVDQFPVTDGDLVLRLLIRELGTEEWQIVSEYPIEVELNKS